LKSYSNTQSELGLLVNRSNRMRVWKAMNNKSKELTADPYTIIFPWSCGIWCSTQLIKSHNFSPMCIKNRSRFGTSCKRWNREESESRSNRNHEQFRVRIWKITTFSCQIKIWELVKRVKFLPANMEQIVTKIWESPKQNSENSRFFKFSKTWGHKLQRRSHIKLPKKN